MKRETQPLKQHISYKTYYWVLGKENGRRVIVGAFRTSDEADQDGYKNFQDYEVIPLPTRDRTAAREMLRKRVLDETHSINEAFQRFRHVYTEDTLEEE